MKMRILCLGCWAVVAVAMPSLVWSASPAAKEPAQAVGLFEGIESGAIEVTVIPKDSTVGTITFKNKTDKPLTIKLPEAYAGVPVLAQGALAGAGLGGGGANDVGGGGGANQGFGGGMMGGMMGGGMMGGGMFNVPAEKAIKGKITIVCMDHGQKEPNPRVPYKLIPIEQYSKSADVTEVIKMLVKGELDQHSAQAAVWHLQNGLSWEELAKKIGVKHINGSTEPYFTAVQLQRAFAAAHVAKKRAEAVPSEKASGSIGEVLANQP